ncbi:MAG: hypothetical protein WD250_15495 [Egibacteraceae bacterium]
MFSDVCVEQIAGLHPDEQVSVLSAAVRLYEDPAGKHPLSSPLQGWNTEDVLAGEKRIIYRAGDVNGVGLIDVLCLGPRSANKVYDMAAALVASGLLTDDEVTFLWEALTILDILAEDVGLDGWDFRPEPAPEGMRLAAVRSGLLTEEQASLLSRDEIEAAMTAGWAAGAPDPRAALIAALERARDRTQAPADTDAVLSGRAHGRCGVVLPRAGAACIRKHGHPGPHRASP